MIRTIKVDLNAAYPNMPLEPVNVFAGSAASFTICNVPRAVGDRAITSVALEFKTRGGLTETIPAVRVGSAYEVTIPASRFPLPYSAALGVRIVGIGKDENKSGATWVLGVADLIVLNNQGQVTPGADAGDVKHSEFADLDPDNTPLAVVIERLKGSAMSLALVITSMLVSFTAVAALPVTPVYTNHNRVAGNVQTMTNIQEWASAVESAIGQGGGLDTNGVQAVIQRNVDTNYLCTVATAQAMTNGRLPATYADYHWTVPNYDIVFNGSLFCFGSNFFIGEAIGSVRVLSWNNLVAGNSIETSQSLSEYVSDACGSATNSAKAYADATFRTRTDNVCHADGFTLWVPNGVPEGVTLVGQPILTEAWNWIDSDGYFWVSSVETSETSTFEEFAAFNGPHVGEEFTARRSVSATSGKPFVTYDNVPSTNGLESASHASATYQPKGDYATKPDSTNAAVAVVGEVMDYALTNLTGAAVSLASGQIGNLALDNVTSNLTLKLDFAAATDRSGDAMLYLVNAADTFLAIAPAASVTPIGYTASDALKAGTNIVLVTRMAYADGKSIVNVAIKEVK